MENRHHHNTGTDFVTLPINAHADTDAGNANAFQHEDFRDIHEPET